MGDTTAIINNEIPEDERERLEEAARLAEGAEDKSKKEDAEATRERIIRQAKWEADDIKRTAEREAEKQRIQTEAECNRLREETLVSARDAGYNEGYAKGEFDADALRIEARGVLDEALTTRELLFAEIEPEVVALTVKLTQRIVGAEREFNPDLIRILIKSALGEITTNGGIKIRVSSDDVAAAEMGRDEFLSKMEGGSDVEIIRDLSLKKGDCIIETPYGSVDCSLDGQLEQLRENLYLILNGE
jgi:flagellar assembly protein FliH